MYIVSHHGLRSDNSFFIALRVHYVCMVGKIPVSEQRIVIARQTQHLYNAVLMLSKRRRRWTNNKPPSVQSTMSLRRL